MQIQSLKLSSITWSQVKLTDDVECGDEADETDAHDENDGRRDLQARGVIRVEAEHVDTRARAAAGPGGSGRSGRSAGSAAAHPGRRSCWTARSHDSGPWGRGRRCLRLWCASRHGWTRAEQYETWLAWNRGRESWEMSRDGWMDKTEIIRKLVGYLIAFKREAVELRKLTAKVPRVKKVKKHSYFFQFTEDSFSNIRETQITAASTGEPFQCTVVSSSTKQYYIKPVMSLRG